MTKKTTAITLSIFIAIMPFLGFPTQLKTAFYVGSGLLLVVLIELISIQGRKRNFSNVNKNDVSVEIQINTDEEKDSVEEHKKEEDKG